MEEVEQEMREAAKNLDFERAMQLRDILFEHDNYKDVIVNSILLGNDTDTVAAIAGGIAGLHYGYESIPEDWLVLLKGKNIVEKLLSSSI